MSASKLRSTSWISLLAMLAALLILAAAPAVAAPPSSFTAVTLGTVQPTSESTFQLSGVGTGSRIGAYTYEGEVVVESVDQNGVITDTLTETLRLANGDTITILCHQVAVPVSPGVYEGTDQWTVIGGTGRYAGASGSGTGTTHVDLNDGTFAKSMTGSIQR